MDKGLIVHTLIINDKNEILIIKRAEKINDVLYGYWDIPGGTLEDDEDPMTGAIREAKEETNLDLSNPSLYTYTSNVDNSKNKQFVRIIFIASYESGKIKLDPREHEEFTWVNFNKINNYKVVDYLPECIKILTERKHKLFCL